MTSPQFLGSISGEDVLRLCRIFAQLTPSGWIVPEWLTWLAEQVKARDR